MIFFQRTNNKNIMYDKIVDYIYNFCIIILVEIML